MKTTSFVNPARIRRARLAADMSRADLAFAIRGVSEGRIRSTERAVRGWEKGEYKPSDGVIPAVAAATGKPIEFFYETDDDSSGEDGSGDDDGEPEQAVSLDEILRRHVRSILRQELGARS